MISNRFLFCCRIATFLNHKETIFNGLKNSRGRYLLRITGNSHLYESIHDYSTEANKPGTKQQNIKQKSTKLLLKTPKGTCDHGPNEMALRQKVFGQIETIFQQFGARAIDTPVFELKEVLTGKYGEDSKLIYDLADQGGEILSLRYDLTVPLARYLAMNKIANLKRYQIGKVYRRDTPSVAQGRHREFYQCDFDIVGSGDSMLSDVECVKVMSEILNSLDIGEYLIKLNHRELLNGLFEACGVHIDKFKSICSAVDKLDKLSWDEVKREMVEEKGLSEDVANKIGEYTRLNGHNELIDKLLLDDVLNKFSSTVKGLEDLKLLLHYCNLLGIKNKVSVDLSLARGLDYYTGVIFEAVLKDQSANESKSIGSIAAGGRYDDLIGSLDGKGNSVPCVGISIGVERILTILEAKYLKENESFGRPADIYVISAHKGLHEERLKIINRLWSAGLRSEHSHKQNPKILHQMQYCEKYKIPFGIIIGTSELQQNIVKLRVIDTREEIDVPIDNLEMELKKRIEEFK